MPDSVTPTTADTSLRAQIASELLSGMFAHQPPRFSSANHDPTEFSAVTRAMAEKAVVAADILLAQLSK